jgi:hypothetical protein
MPATLVANQSVGNGCPKGFTVTQTSTNQISNLIVKALPRVKGLGEGLLKDIDSATAAQFPDQNGQPITCNHPVFVFGHLSIYPQMVMGMLGGDTSTAAVPETYKDLFMHGVDCQHDKDNTIYPTLDEVVNNFNKAYDTLTEFAKTLDDDFLAKDIEGNDGFKDAFGTNGVMLMFLLHDHPMFHFGQVSTWRRAMGLGSVM